MSLWFGYEWEIAASAVCQDGTVEDMSRLLNGFEQTLRNYWKHVRCEHEGCFLESGGRFYRDAAEGGLAHNEYASPECDHPDELLRQSLAADRMMLHAAELLRAEKQYQGVRISKANVSVVSEESWGLHENYEASRPVASAPMLLWLAGRILLTGAGGLDATFPGIRFTLSPRAHFFTAAMNNATQWDRGLHNVGKACAHGNRHRVHVVAGDGNRSDFSIWLKFACTALVVRLIDLGRFPDFELQDPVRAIRCFSLDPDQLAGVPCHGARPMVDALGIHRAFLDVASASLGDLPDWAPGVIDEWKRVIGTLAEQGWRPLARELDWPAKLSLFERVIERSGWNRESLRAINTRIEELMPRALRRVRRSPGMALEAGILSCTAVIHQLMEKETDPGLWKSFLALREQLAVVDARYMELGGESLHEAACPDAGRVSRLVAASLEDPLRLPAPPSGRASLRARLVTEFGWTDDEHEYRSFNALASWTFFMQDQRVLSMPDVGSDVEPAWQEFRPRVTESPPARSEHLELIATAIREAECAIDSGEYEMAITSMNLALPSLSEPEIPRHDVTRFWRYMTRLQCRRQQHDEVDECIAALEAADSDPLEVLWDASNACCHIGLTGHPATRGMAERVSAAMDEMGMVRVSGRACWKSHMALWHNRNLRFDDAFSLLEPTFYNGDFDGTSNSVRIRILTQLAEARRIIGDFPVAIEMLDRAERMCVRGRYHANHLDLCATTRAKVLASQGETLKALKLLERRILPAQQAIGMPGHIRTRLLIHRIVPPAPGHLTRVRDSLIEGIKPLTGYAKCPLMNRILDHWETWCGGGHDPLRVREDGVLDRFWGV